MGEYMNEAEVLLLLQEELLEGARFSTWERNGPGCEVKVAFFCLLFTHFEFAHLLFYDNNT